MTKTRLSLRRRDLGEADFIFWRTFYLKKQLTTCLKHKDMLNKKEHIIIKRKYKY